MFLHCCLRCFPTYCLDARDSEIKVYEVKTSSAAGKTLQSGGETNKRIKDPALNETVYLIVSEN